ncbi:Aryl-phospho-beta-D-glucosidase BglA [Frankliniella fusca]|uniref:Aryl-phospho-beta-D-glucosidase BglA n=1 Tax=Frankliniella fusca TaxID=407009 RepID=A0AAE1GV07_9NEOP|nr:Aryl-phospho-beta-D-glucosidase BglA [Frankliniella fusca]
MAGPPKPRQPDRFSPLFSCELDPPMVLMLQLQQNERHIIVQELGTSDFLGFNVYNGLKASWQNPKTSNVSSTSVPMGPTLELLPFVRAEFPDLTGADTKKTVDFYEKAKPDVMREALVWVSRNYRKPIVVSENGFGDVLGHGKHDQARAAYHSEFLQELIKTMKAFDIEVLSYCVWSLVDTWEFTSEFRRPFGLVHIDRSNGTLDRSLKDSAWFWITIGETGVVPSVSVSSSSIVAPFRPLVIVVLMILCKVSV